MSLLISSTHRTSPSPTNAAQLKCTQPTMNFLWFPDLLYFLDDIVEETICTRERAISMNWNGYRVLLALPQGLDSSALVIAAERAGGLGILDGTEQGLRDRAIRRMQEFRVRSYAVRVEPEQVSEGWLEQAGKNLVAVICTNSETPAQLNAACTRVKSTGRLVLCEVTSAAEAEAALDAGADGLIAVGHEAGGRVGRIPRSSCSRRSSRGRIVRSGSAGASARGSAAGCLAAGAAGVVLDGAVLLARESPLAEEVRERISGWDGSETIVIEPKDAAAIRVYAPPMSPVLARLREAANMGARRGPRALNSEVGWGPGQAWPVGQEPRWLRTWPGGTCRSAGSCRRSGAPSSAGSPRLRKARPLAVDAPLARAHGCRLPILQGPMTRVSDVAPFAEAVAREGGLPFVAPGAAAAAGGRAPARGDGPAARRAPLGRRPARVRPGRLREEQLAAIRAVRPPFALIAGGRPDQAAELERDGIATYLHVPSPGLLDQFLRAGARRFVLEGRECGGHVGPRSSFVLWEQACRVLEAAIEAGLAAESLSVVFAGGIHDARSAAVVAAMAGDLAARGVKIGVLMGTAYLFTREAVTTGAIVPRFQDEALRCARRCCWRPGRGTWCASARRRSSTGSRPSGGA